MGKTSRCCNCGFDWETGRDGSHSCHAVLKEKISVLIGKFDRLEDNNHNAAETAAGVHAKDVFSTAGTTYGICAEDLRILIGRSV